jgi:hypothetical protein
VRHVNNEPERRHRLARGASAEEMTEHQPKVVGRDLDRVALLDVGHPPQPSPAQAANVEDQGEATFDLLGTQLERNPGNAALQARPIVIDRPPGR